MTLLLALPVVASGCAQRIPTPAAHFERWGVETLSVIQRDFWLPERKLYAEHVAGNKDEARQPAFMWGCGVQLAALAAAARVDRAQYGAQLTEYADSLQAYWHVKDGLGGYDVQPNQFATDRYYDDNAWIVLALVETFDTTGDAKYLDRALATQRFVMSGEDDTLGGGLYWRENERASKNTCANAPGMVGALLLYQRTRDPAQLAAAERLYAWTCKHLQDPQDGLFWDAIRRDGELDRRKFTYNSAVMIRANCLLYELKGDAKYLDEARRIARAAVAHWIDPQTGAVRDAGHFAFMLLEALLEVARLTGDDTYRDVVSRSVAYVHDQLHDEAGHYPNRWHPTDRRPRHPAKLLDQACVARLYFTTARALRDTPPKSPNADGETRPQEKPRRTSPSSR